MSQQKEITTYFWVRVGVMFASLVAVLFSIWKLNQFGPEDLTMVLCPTRVSSIATADGQGIVQEGMKWYRRKNGNLEELDPVAVEKWFAKNCRINIEPHKKAEAAGVVFVASFVNGPPETLYMAGEGLFRWKDKTFKSKHLEDAMSSMKDLPIFLRPTSR